MREYSRKALQSTHWPFALEKGMCLPDGVTLTVCSRTYLLPQILLLYRGSQVWKSSVFFFPGDSRAKVRSAFSGVRTNLQSSAVSEGEAHGEIGQLVRLTKHHQASTDSTQSTKLLLNEVKDRKNDIELFGGGQVPRGSEMTPDISSCIEGIQIKHHQMKVRSLPEDTVFYKGP